MDQGRTTAVAEPLLARPHGRGSPWPSVAVLGLGSFAIGTAVFVVAGVLGGLAADLGVSAGAAGLTVTAFAVGSAVGGPVLSALLGARPQRPVLVGALAVFAAGNVLGALAPSLPVLLAARVLSALAAGIYVPTAGAAAVAAVPATHRGRALAVVLGGASAAMALGAPLGVLLAAALSWRATFALVAVLAAVAVAGLLAVNAGSGTVARIGLHERLRPLASRAVVSSLAVTLLVMTGSNSAFTYLDPVLAPTVGASGLALVLAVFGVGGATGAWWGGVVADRWGGRRAVPAAAGLLTGVMTLTPLAVTTAAGAVAFVFTWGVAVWSFVPAQQHLLVGLGAGPPPLVLALNSSAINLGFAVGSVLGGGVVDAGGASGLWAVGALCGAVALVVHRAVATGSRS